MADSEERSVLHEICERVWTQRRALAVTGADFEAYTVHIAPNLWQRLLRETGSNDPLVREGKMFSLKAVRDNTLDDDQIRLRHEVVA